MLPSEAREAVGGGFGWKGLLSPLPRFDRGVSAAAKEGRMRREPITPGLCAALDARLENGEEGGPMRWIIS